MVGLNMSWKAIADLSKNKAGQVWAGSQCSTEHYCYYKCLSRFLHNHTRQHLIYIVFFCINKLYPVTCDRVNFDCWIMSRWRNLPCCDILSLRACRWRYKKCTLHSSLSKSMQTARLEYTKIHTIDYKTWTHKINHRFEQTSNKNILG